MKKILLAFGLQFIPVLCFGGIECGSSAYQYTLDFCAKETGVVRGEGSSLASTNCYWAADYMDVHPKTTVEETAAICSQAPYSSARGFCEVAVWAYIRARQR